MSRPDLRPRTSSVEAPSNAVAEVRARVDFVSACPGGDGAVRELVELILRAQGQWDSLVTAYETEAES